MGFKIRYGSPADYAKLGAMAGKADRAREDAQLLERRAQEVRQMKFRTDMAEKEAELSEANVERNIQFQFDKIAMSQQHDFQMELQRKERNEELLAKRRETIELARLQKEMRKQSDIDAKLEAINDSDNFSEQEKADARMYVETGYRVPRRGDETLALINDMLEGKPMPPSEAAPVSIPEPFGKTYATSEGPVTRPKPEIASTGQSVGSMFGGGIVRQQPAPDLTKADVEKVKTLDAESQAQFNQIIKEGNPDKIRLALNRLRKQ